MGLPRRKKPRRGRLVPLAAGLLVLGGLYLRQGNLPPELLRPKETSGQVLLETELPLWNEDEPEPVVPPGGEDISAEPALPAADSICEEPLLPESVPEDGGTAVERTIRANGNTLRGPVEVNNNTDHQSVDTAAIAASELERTIHPASEGPQILIMHTHATEAYTMAGEDIYRETDYSRTDDPQFNVLRVGEEMKQVFEEMGFSVLHDTTLYDYPGYNGSYGRSLKGVQSYLEQYPTIAVVLDIHRDALIASDGTVYKAVTELNGKKTAQVMLVLGTDDGGLDHPNWPGNLRVAAHIQQKMMEVDKTLCRPINLRSQRFNQHLTPNSMLVEVGTSGNTLQEALRGAREFARCAGEVYKTMVTE